MSDSDDELEEIYDRIFDLNEFTDPDQYKSYDELAARLALVLGESNKGFTPELARVEEPAPAKVAPAPEPVSADAEEDDTMSYFAKLAAEE